MKHLFLSFLLCLTPLLAMAQGSKALTLQEVVGGQFRPDNIYGVIPIPGDGEHYSQMNDEGTQIIKYSFRTGKQVEVLFDAATARECTFKSFDSYSFSPDGTKLLIATETKPIYRHSYTATHYIYSLKRNIEGRINNVVERLSDGGPQQVPVFSPDGNMVAFVRDNNIFLVKLLYGNSESQVTEDGKFNEVINGIPDWVYEEEFAYDRALSFSADSKMLAFMRTDESQVKSYSFPLFAGDFPRMDALAKYPGAYTYKYPKTGEDNAKVSVHTFDIKSKVTRKMQLPLDKDGYIPRIRFTKDANKLAIITLNRHQDRLDLYFADPRSTLCKLILREESSTYLSENIFDNIRFYDDGFTLLSAASGYNQLYWYDFGGKRSALTTGTNEVKEFLGRDEQSNTFYYSAYDDSPLRTAIFKLEGNRKGKSTRLSTQRGTHTALFSSNMKYYLNRFHNVDTPYLITLCDHTGRTLATLEDNATLRSQLAQYALPKKEFFSFNTSEGIQLNGWMMKPTDFDASKQYPVIMYQYSGPGSQEVLDQYGISWETYMASRGYVVVCVDGRGTGGRGAEFKTCTYLNLGVKEADDQVETALWLGRQSYVDKNRIGIWGWSYGGYMTLMSMSQGTPVFRAGVAVAAVTDWNYYDTIYGERFMRTPQENADGYTAGSCFTRADKLSGSLLLIHGMADDNVHYQNCAEYAEHLVQLGKDFDMMVYTNRNHGISGGNTRLHLYSKITKFFDRELAK